MKQLNRAAVACLAVVSFLFSFTATAQVQTARPNVNVSVRCKGYYEYLPQGYDPAGTATYPMILFFTGIGEFGNGGSSELSRVLKNGPPKLIKDGTFPTSFSVLGQTFRPIVITPQFITGSSPSAADVDTVLQYMLAHYKVNPNRVYLTGLSYGGGLSFAYPGNRNTNYAARIAAIVPTASPLPLPKETGYDTIYARGRFIAAANIPVWATHNKYDRYPDSSLNTITYVNDINLAPAPNPLARMTIFNVSGHDSWTKTYDPDFRENGYNVYEWMLLYEKGVPPPPPNKAPKVNAGADKVITLPTNSVTITAVASDSDGTIASYSWKQLYGPAPATIVSGTTASPTFSALVQGYYTFRVTASDDKGAKATDDVMVTVNYVNVPGTKYINVNMYGGANAYSNTAWNNWNLGTSAATNKTSAAFKYSDGTTSAVSAVLSATSTVSDNGSTYGSGMAPAGVLRYTSYYTGTRTLTISGLSTSKTYNLQLFGSRNSSTAYYTTFKVNSDSVKVNAYNNYSNKAVFNNVAPDPSGQIVITIIKSNTYNYLNGFVIVENSNTRFVKANVYGGSNAYSSVEWNNWNVGTTAATNKNSGAMKYSDGTTSKVSAVLSATSSVLDNGSTYGGGMAPAEVLRYNSAYGSLRTLTLNGLSTSKTYNLELYASHKSTTTNNNTIFSINGVSVTINVNSNLTNKASFTNVVPNSSGQIVVSMNKTANNSYLNGFILTENTGGGATIKQNSAALEVVTERDDAAEGASISVSPNPVNSAVQLRLQNSYKGAVQVQLTDESGRVWQVWRFEKGSALLQQTLQVNNLSKGVYFVTVQMGTTRQALRISKL